MADRESTYLLRCLVIFPLPRYKTKLNYPAIDWIAKLSTMEMDSIALHEMSVSAKLPELRSE